MTAVDMHCHIVLEPLADALRARTAPPMIERAADGSERMVRHMGGTDIPRTSVEALLTDMDEHGVGQAVLSNLFPDITNIALADSLRSHQLEPLHPIHSPIFSKLFKLEDFGLVSCHHNFPAIAVRHSVSRAELLQQPIPFHAKARLQKFGRVIDTRMNHAAIARAGGHAQPWRLLQQENVFDADRKLVRDGATHHTTANDDDVNSVHLNERTQP